MARRTTPRSVANDRAFPIRILLRNDTGDTLALKWGEAEAWLNHNLGHAEWAMHGQSKIGLHSMGVYFRTVADAQRFLEAHPRFELEDRTGEVAWIRDIRLHGHRVAKPHSIP